MNSEIVYIGRDNQLSIQLRDNNSGVLADSDLTSVTKVEIVIDDTFTYDSTNHPLVVAYTTGGLVTLRLGRAIREAGEHTVEFILYDATNTNGVVWSPKLHVVAQERNP